VRLLFKNARSKKVELNTSRHLGLSPAASFVNVFSYQVSRIKENSGRKQPPGLNPFKESFMNTMTSFLILIK